MLVRRGRRAGERLPSGHDRRAGESEDRERSSRELHRLASGREAPGADAGRRSGCGPTHSERLAVRKAISRNLRSRGRSAVASPQADQHGLEDSGGHRPRLVRDPRGSTPGRAGRRRRPSRPRRPRRRPPAARAAARRCGVTTAGRRPRPDRRPALDQVADRAHAPEHVRSRARAGRASSRMAAARGRPAGVRLCAAPSQRTRPSSGPRWVSMTAWTSRRPRSPGPSPTTSGAPRRSRAQVAAWPCGASTRTAAAAGGEAAPRDRRRPARTLAPPRAALQRRAPTSRAAHALHRRLAREHGLGEARPAGARPAAAAPLEHDHAEAGQEEQARGGRGHLPAAPHDHARPASRRPR